MAVFGVRSLEGHPLCALGHALGRGSGSIAGVGKSLQTSSQIVRRPIVKALCIIVDDRVIADSV